MRPSYSQGLGEGRTAQELEPAGPAAGEMAALWDYLAGLLWPAVEVEEEPMALSA